MTKITNFVWNPVDDCVISELDGTGAVQAVYTNEPQQYGGVISQRRGTTTSTYHADALGTTRALTDSTGNVTDTYFNDAWGNSVASTGTTVNPFKWVGRYGYYQDSSTGLVYVRARMYQPKMAMWTDLNSIRDRTADIYKYSGNSPSQAITSIGWQATDTVEQSPQWTGTSSSGLLSPQGGTGTKILVRPTGELSPQTIRMMCSDINDPFGEPFSRRTWNFSIPGGAPCEGFMVQKVTYAYSTYDCNAKPLLVGRVTYWEAWLVGFKQELPNGRGGGEPNMDLWATDYSTLRPHADCSTGVVESVGEIRFYCREDTGPGPHRTKYPSGWPTINTSGKPPYTVYGTPPYQITAHGLPTTNVLPPFWSKPSRLKSAERMHKIDWECCPFEKPCCGDGSDIFNNTFSP